MSSELERRLEGLLAAAPQPEPEVGEDALTRALSALQPVAAPRRGLRTAVLVFATAFVLLAVAAGSLAAAGALHVSFGAKKKQLPAASTQLSLPQGANGVAAIVDGRLSVVIKGGFRLQGLPASAAALSPHALYVAAGIGSSLVAMAPDGRRAWSHPAGGTVVAIAWAPDGLRIAYVVRSSHRFALRVIYGNGTHDAVVDRSVRPVRPSWRADSLAFAYVGGGGMPIVYDLGHASRAVVRSPAARGAQWLAFSPGGSTLAVGTKRTVVIAWRHVRQVLRGSETGVRGPLTGLGWYQGRLFVAGRTDFRRFPEGGGRVPPGERILAFAAQRQTLALAIRARQSTRLVANDRTIAVLPRRATIRDLQIG